MSSDLLERIKLSYTRSYLVDFFGLQVTTLQYYNSLLGSPGQQEEATERSEIPVRAKRYLEFSGWQCVQLCRIPKISAAVQIIPCLYSIYPWSTIDTAIQHNNTTKMQEHIPYSVQHSLYKCHRLRRLYEYCLLYSRKSHKRTLKAPAFTNFCWTIDRVSLHSLHATIMHLVVDCCKHQYGAHM